MSGKIRFVPLEKMEKLPRRVRQKPGESPLEKAAKIIAQQVRQTNQRPAEKPFCTEM